MKSTGVHGKHDHKMMSETTKSSGSADSKAKVTSSSDGTSTGTPSSSGATAAGGTGYAKGDRGIC